MTFVWNVLDRQTRFLLASKLSSHRSVIGATNAFNEAKRVAHGTKPERIYADSWSAYPEGLKNAYGSERPRLTANAGVGKPHKNNNRIERLNGTLRERVKVQRGWKTMKTPLAEGARIHYNFVKPHQALDGKTPAQVAGVGIDARNKWLAMLKEAITQNRTEDESPIERTEQIQGTDHSSCYPCVRGNPDNNLNKLVPRIPK